MKKVQSPSATTDPEVEGTSSSETDSNSKIPSNMVSIESVNSRVEAARKEEKGKLYDDLNKLREEQKNHADSVSSLTSENETLNSKNKELSDQLESFKSAKTDSGGVDIEKLITELSNKHKTSLEEGSNQRLSELAEQNKSLQNELKQMRLDSYRKELISQHGGKLVEALVIGDSEEALAASVEVAKSTYDNIISQANIGHASNASNNSGSSVNQNQPSTTPPPNLPDNGKPENNAGGNSGDQFDGVNRDSFSSLNIADRNSVLKKLKAKYG